MPAGSIGVSASSPKPTPTTGDHHDRTRSPNLRSRLEQLGYSQQLERRLNIPEVVGLAMADVSPTMAVLFLSAGVFVVGGTFSVGAGLILSVVVVLISLCLASSQGCSRSPAECTPWSAASSRDRSRGSRCSTT